MDSIHRLVRKIRSGENSLNTRFNIFTIAFILILLVGIFARTWEFGTLPPGLNQDEASIGVEAYDLYHYGIDRNGVAFPVNFISWGSGQNALYGYLLIPFIAIGGLNPITVRLPMLMTGILTLPLVFFVAKRLLGNIYGLVAMFLVAISPWHIILSRWGLESNLLPFTFLIGFACLLKSRADNYWFVPANLFFALSLYAYGTAYAAVPIFILCAIAVLLYARRISLKSIFLGLAVLLILGTPIGLLVLINAMGWNSIRLWVFTIPRLPVQARFEGVAAIFNGHPLHAIKLNILTLLALLWKQSDGLIWNSLSPYGYFYLVTLPLAIIGAFLLIPLRRSAQSPERWLLLAWLGASLAIGAIQSVNINRINLIFIPLLICIAVFLEWLDRHIRILSVLALLGLLIAFSLFTRDYHGVEYRQQAGRAFFQGLIPALDYARQTGSEPICVTDQINMPYIYVLFTDHMNPRDYLPTIKYTDPRAPFRMVQSLGRYTFGLHNCPPVSSGTIYILSPQEIPDQSASYQSRNFGNYRVYIPLQDGTQKG